jgi:hypothetical protein
VVAITALGLASGKLLFSTTTTHEVVRTVTTTAPADRGAAAALDDQGTAEANVWAAVPAVEAYFADNGTYHGLTKARVAFYDGAAAEQIVSHPRDLKVVLH